MSVTKKQRQQVYDKSGGHCWYCGHDLPDRWHVDHVEPVRRSYEGKIEAESMHLHQVDNMVPSCPPCNMFKSASSLEQFRRHIERLPSIMREYSVKFRNAERFGMIDDMREPVVFWFEG
tara:strand:+ start:18728 stop:19084 length:357 start_codon:yes stop_codon:yes gene_type:complete